MSSKFLVFKINPFFFPHAFCERQFSQHTDPIDLYQFKNLYLFLTTLKKRIKKFKAHAMKKRTHLRAKIQRVLTMKPDSVSFVSTATSNLFTHSKNLTFKII